MANSQIEKARTHKAIVATAAKRFRELGLNGVGVADIMKESGRTGGGFYKHFQSREHLVEEVLERMFDARMELLQQENGRDFAKRVEAYLSRSHRDAPGSGCALSALLNDMARAGDGSRKLYSEQLEREIGCIEQALAATPQPQRRADAVLAACTMIGALALARAASDESLSDEILDVRKTLVKKLRT